MTIEILSTIANTILLIILFFYQKNKNKVLLDRIQHQENLLNETKSIVSQQSTAIESQSRVVDTALKYSELFDPKKIEGIVRKEMQIDHKAEIEQLRSDYEKQKIGHKIDDEALEVLNAKLAEIFFDIFSDFASPALEAFIKILYKLPYEDRNKILQEIPSGNGKNLIIKIMEDIDRNLSDVGFSPNPKKTLSADG